jgi:hypothetical protein
MNDPVMSQLSAQGYQPIFLPLPGISPPEIYVYLPQTRKLERHGPLSFFLPEANHFTPEERPGPDLGNMMTQTMDGKATVNFLGKILNWFGISGDMNATFHFADNARFRYRFHDVTALVIERHNVDNLIRDLKFSGSLERHMVAGNVHIVLEYLYARKIELRHADGKNFDIATTAELDGLFNASASNKLERQKNGYISFKSQQGVGAAFAYKAKQIFRYDGKLEIGLQAKSLGNRRKGKELENFYIPAHGEFLNVVNAEFLD